MEKQKYRIQESTGDRLFTLVILFVLILFGILMAVAMIAELAVSLSSKIASQTGSIGLLPVGFTFASWEFMLRNAGLWTSFGISAVSTAIVVVVSLLINAMMAYPLSKKNFPPVKALMLIVVFTMIFKAPTIPYFLTLRGYGLYNSFWAMVVPQVISAYNLLVMRSFFQTFPQEVEEAAAIDGCGKFRMFFRIVLPSSKAVIATVGLFYGVGAWNQYATPLMMIQDTALFPLQLKIHQLVNAASGDIAAAVKVSTANYTNDTLGAAAVIFSMIPVLMIYPFVQKYFAKGAMLGSVKG